MINKLTTAQEKKLEAYHDKWLKIGLSTDQFDLETARPIIDGFYKNILKNKNRVPIVIMRSPFEAWVAVVLTRLYLGEKQSQVESQVESQVRSQVWSQVESQVWSQVESQVGSQVESQVGSQVESQVWSQVESQVESQVWSQVESQVGSQVESQVRSQVWSQVRSQVESQVGSQVESQVWSQVESQVWSQVESQVGSQLPDFVYPYADGNFSASWFSFYDFMKSELGVKLDSLFDVYAETTKLSFIYPFDDMCILSQKPIEINMRNGVLHKDGGMAVKYADGFGVYSLNGVRVPEYLAVTKESDLTIKQFNGESNADIRAEFIRKFGIDRMRGIGKTVDSHKKYNNEWWSLSQYELIDMAPIFKNVRYAPHLGMINQTTGAYHLEAVTPDCKTIKDAFEKCRWSGRLVSDYKTVAIK